MSKDQIAPVDLRSSIFRSQKTTDSQPNPGFSILKDRILNRRGYGLTHQKTHQRLLVFKNNATLKMLRKHAKYHFKNNSHQDAIKYYLLYKRYNFAQNFYFFQWSFFWKKSYIWKKGPGNQHWSFNEARKRINKTP